MSFWTAIDAHGGPVLHPVEDACQDAYDICEFKFQRDGGSVPTYDTRGPADEAFTPIITAKDRNVRIGIVNSNGIEPEFVREDGSRWPISEKGRPNFKTTHFKPFFLKFRQFSGIGHQTFIGNQKYIARRKCVVVYFSMFTVLTGSRPPYVKKNVNAVKSDNKCVAFRTA